MKTLGWFHVLSLYCPVLLLSALCLLLCHVPAVAAIPASKTATTNAKFRQQVNAAHRRIATEAYTKCSLHGKAWDTDAQAYLKLWLDTFYNDSGMSLENIKACEKAGAKLEEKQCDDALILYCLAYAKSRDRKNNDSFMLTLKSFARFYHQPAYPRVLASEAAVLMMEHVAVTENVSEADMENFQTELIEWLSAAAREGSLREGEQRVYLSLVLEHWNTIQKKNLDTFNTALTAEPGADAYIVDVIGGRYEMEKAWQSRGGAPAMGVTEEGWKGFFQHLEKSQEKLMRAWKAHPEFPEAPAEMITVAMGNNGKNGKPRTWFDNAVTAQIDYMPAYGKLLYALMPRWGGSHEAMYKFAVECLETNRFDTEVPQFFLVTLFNIENDIEGDDTYWKKPETYKHVQTLFAGEIKDSATDDEKYWYQSLYAGFAWYCGKYTESRRLLDELGDHLNATPLLNTFHVQASRLKDEVYEKTGGKAAQEQ